MSKTGKMTELNFNLMLIDELEFENTEQVDIKAIKRLKSVISYKRLEDMYKRISSTLSKHHKKTVAQTLYEIKFQKIIRRTTKTRQLYHSFWIGRTNFDFFIPYVAGPKGDKRMRGIAFEIDGPIHNHEMKMRKDNQKADILKDLGIAVINVENHDLYTPTLKSAFEYLTRLPKLDYRAKRRLLANIYAFTILSNKQLLNAARSK